jgi:hypothetical protein
MKQRSGTQQGFAIFLIFLIFLIGRFAFAGSNPYYTNRLNLNNVIAPPPYDSIVYTVLSDGEVAEVWRDINYTDTIDDYHAWRDITFMPHSTAVIPATGKIGLTITGFDPFSAAPDTVIRNIFTEKLTVEDTSLTTRVIWRFTGSNNEINLRNGAINFTITQPGFNYSALAINATVGNNTLLSLRPQGYFPGPVTINVNNGATLVFDEVGRMVTDEGEWLGFGDRLTANIDNGTLRFNASRVLANFSDFNLTNGGTLATSGTDTWVKLDSVSLIDSNLSVGRGTRLEIPSLLQATNATVSMETNSDLAVGALVADGAVLFRGDDSRQNYFEAFLMSSSGNPASFTFIDMSPVTVDNFYVETGCTVDVDNSTVRVNRLSMTGGTLNLANISYLNLNAPISYLDGAINLSNYSHLNVTPNGDLTLSGSLAVDLGGTGTIDVTGALTGSGTITGGGKLEFHEEHIAVGQDVQGTLSPGRNDLSSALAIGTIRTDARISFYTGLELRADEFHLDPDGVLDGGIYIADVMVDSTGNASNDQLLYGDGDVNLAQIKELRVNVLGNPTANSLDGHLFTVIAAQDAGKAGTIILHGQEIPLVESSGVPALIDFTVVDLNTNNHPDVTLQAYKNIDHLLKHPVLQQTGNLSASATLLTNAYNSGNTTAINALNSLANAQIGSNLDSLHAESYASHLTVTLEYANMLMETVLNRTGAGPMADFSTGRSRTDISLGTHKHFWVDASYTDGNVAGSDGLSGFDYGLSSLVAGQDLLVGDNGMLGLFFAYGKQEMDECERAVQDFKGYAYSLGLYLNCNNVGPLTVNSVLGYTFGDHESTRRMVLGNTTASPSANFSGHSIYGGVKASMSAYRNDWLCLSPEIGLNYTWYRQASFTESGDPGLSLALNSATTHSLVSSVGLDAQFAGLTKSFSLYPLAFVRYAHDWYANTDNTHEMDAALAAYPEFRQIFVGRNRGTHAFMAGIGLGGNLSDALRINGGFVHTETTHGRKKKIGFNLEYRW